MLITLIINPNQKSVLGANVISATSLPVEVWLCERPSSLYAGHIQRLHRAFKRHVRVDCPEAAEVVNPNQQGGGLAHGSHIQLPGDRHLFNRHHDKQYILYRC